MSRRVNNAFEAGIIAQQLVLARRERGLTQAELASRCHLERQQITYFERGTRLPSLPKLLRIAQALDLPLQRFLSGSDRPESGVQGIAIELRRLGLVDLWVESPAVPGAFRRPEEVVVLSVAPQEPESRILEAVPALLAWNRWNGALLRGFAKSTAPRTLYRLAWLADVALALDRMGGFPDGCPGKDDLAAFVKRVEKPPGKRWDDVGKPAHEPITSPVWKRWRIHYAANLASFQQRAKALASIRSQTLHRNQAE
jgi:transcriptional regulator with XRE-family HTH domain